ncbi:MAG: YgiQ family radical SAM protein [Anaerolineales bacterium]|nr:YgiQ family radical SAM protein [Anaerolineales bacterium]
MFIPTTKEELRSLGWDSLDVILITGDSYVDSPFIGVSMIGKILLNAGYRVGIIAQPDIHNDDITRLGEPGLFWGVTGGSIDSMVANYTALKKRKKQDDLTPGGENIRRPDRAVIVYSNLIRRYFKETAPIVLGGLEASLRRIAHYDYWSDSIRRSILFDARADYLLYGMAENTVLQLANIFKKGSRPEELRGLCYISKEPVSGAIELPSFKEVAEDKNAFVKMFHTFYQNNDAITAGTLVQLQDTRYLVQTPPPFPLSQPELDELYKLDYEYAQHPWYEQSGSVRALDTIQFSLTTHRGCYGECNFCSIAIHQGRTVTWRSESSLLQEARTMIDHPDFKGTIADVGGPTANMYGFECKKKTDEGSCSFRRCLVPSICPNLPVNHNRQRSLLQKLRQLPGVKHVFVASGIRYDLVLKDTKHGGRYLRDVVRWHTSGQMKIAPEHTSANILKLMGKPGPDLLLKFRDLFYDFTSSFRKKQYLTYYLIAAHPGCTENDMKDLKTFTGRNLWVSPEQVQIFTPTPSTYSSLMYYTEKDPFTGKKIFVEKDLSRKKRQKQIITRKTHMSDGKKRSG